MKKILYVSPGNVKNIVISFEKICLVSVVIRRFEYRNHSSINLDHYVHDY